MTVTTLPAATATGPMHDAGCADDHSHPAPLATMLAVLGRIASHAGGPLTLTVTEPGQTIHVTLDCRDRYAAWVTELAADALVVGTHPFEASTCLHGWSMTLTCRDER